MIITIVVDNPNSWILPYAKELANKLRINHDVELIHNYNKLRSGDLAVLLSCETIINKNSLNFNKSNIVIHASDLPKGRGWSPLTWQILEGKNKIPISLFEAVEQVDAGPVYIKDWIDFDGTELLPEIHNKLGKKIIDLVETYISVSRKKPLQQIGEPTFYPKRTHLNSELDITKSIEEQFNLFRISDNEKYPVFFKYKNKSYILKVYLDINQNDK